MSVEVDSNKIYGHTETQDQLVELPTGGMVQRRVAEALSRPIAGQQRNIPSVRVRHTWPKDQPIGGIPSVISILAGPERTQHGSRANHWPFGQQMNFPLIRAFLNIFL